MNPNETSADEMPQPFLLHSLMPSGEDAGDAPQSWLRAWRRARCWEGVELNEAGESAFSTSTKRRTVAHVFGIHIHFLKVVRLFDSASLHKMSLQSWIPGN